MRVATTHAMGVFQFLGQIQRFQVAVIHSSQPLSELGVHCCIHFGSAQQLLGKERFPESNGAAFMSHALVTSISSGGVTAAGRIQRFQMILRYACIFDKLFTGIRFGSVSEQYSFQSEGTKEGFRDFKLMCLSQLYCNTMADGFVGPCVTRNPQFPLRSQSLSHACQRGFRKIHTLALSCLQVNSEIRQILPTCHPGTYFVSV